jgi:hypothetical protein
MRPSSSVPLPVADQKMMMSRMMIRTSVPSPMYIASPSCQHLHPCQDGLLPLRRCPGTPAARSTQHRHARSAINRRGPEVSSVRWTHGVSHDLVRSEVVDPRIAPTLGVSRPLSARRRRSLRPASSEVLWSPARCCDSWRDSGLTDETRTDERHRTDDPLHLGTPPPRGAAQVRRSCGARWPRREQVPDDLRLGDDDRDGVARHPARVPLVLTRPAPSPHPGAGRARPPSAAYDEGAGWAALRDTTSSATPYSTVTAALNQVMVPSGALPAIH